MLSDLPVQEAQELAVDVIGAMKNVKLGVTVLKNRRKASSIMDKLEGERQVMFLRARVRFSGCTWGLLSGVTVIVGYVKWYRYPSCRR